MNTHTVAPSRNIIVLQALKNAPGRLSELAAQLPPAAHDWRPRPTDWSLRQVAAHLAAAEPLFHARLERLVAEADPWLPYFGPEVARPDSSASAAEAAADFGAARDRLLDFLSALRPEDWDRPGTHETMGRTTLAQQVQNIANHDADHLGQLYELRRAWENQAHV